MLKGNYVTFPLLRINCSLIKFDRLEIDSGKS